jgi:hypothetical protein
MEQADRGDVGIPSRAKDHPIVLLVFHRIKINDNSMLNQKGN